MKVKTSMFPMESQLVESLPKGKQWRYEPKWDGFRCLAYKRGKKISLRSKSGKPLDRYFPDIVAVLKSIKAERFAIDGELLVEGKGGYSFSDLQLRLHPAASRVQKLAQGQPAHFIIFDLLETDKGQSMLSEKFSKRRDLLEKFYKKHLARFDVLKLSPQTGTIRSAETWLKSPHWRVDGIVAKNVNDAYVPGERIMQKYKKIRTADCVVGGFRYGAGSKEVGSLLLGLYDEDGLLHHVGFTSSLAMADKKSLTKKLEKLAGGTGFTGKAPGMPSRWSTERTAAWTPLKPGMVVEVSFDHVTDRRFRHGTKLLRFRPDKAPRQCKMEQIL